jgi:metal-dependent amidase/aminoacylase/carboxypeptidase family protein
MDLNDLKAAVQREIDQVAGLLIETSDWMADNPEIGLQEHKASARLTEILSEFGAAVERGIAGLPTAFEARLPGGGRGPKVAIVAEYDALPEVGHGCGHNIIATAALGAGLALEQIAQRNRGERLCLHLRRKARPPQRRAQPSQTRRRASRRCCAT